MDDLLREFLAETAEWMDELDQKLVLLERDPHDRELIGGIFRVVHTIKGTSGFLGLPRLEAVAHAAEEALVGIREGRIERDREAIALILSALDRIRKLLAAIENGGAEPTEEDDCDLIDPLTALSGSDTENGEDRRGHFLEAAEAAAATSSEIGATAPAPSIRVGVDLLEKLMTMVSELVLTRNQLMQILQPQEDATLAGPLQRLNTVIAELQDGVTRVRMQPVASLWAKLPRLTRDLAAELGKSVELRLDGGETQLDRQILELVRDPLTHLVRNAVDHGIEPPQRRVAAGKPECGTIGVKARHEDGFVIIEVSDDGAGLDVSRIREKAIRNGLASEATLAAAGEREIQRLIFEPGFSTAETVSQISGRGVGMDVVRANIERVGGLIALDSTPGFGTTVTLRIPLTLAIMPVLLVGSGDRRFAIPRLNIRELLRTGRGEHCIETLGGASLLRLRGTLVPVASLSRLLEIDEHGGESIVAVCEAGRKRFGIAIDEVIGAQDIVVKPLAPVLRGIDLLAAAGILDDGSVTLILDPEGLAAASGAATTEEDAQTEAFMQAEPARQRDERRPMLLFRAGGMAPKAIALDHVQRVEEFLPDEVEHVGGQLVVQYRDRLLPLAQISNQGARSNSGRRMILVIGERDRSVGLMVDEIFDVIEDRFSVDTGASRPGVLGSAVIAGRATEILDPLHYVENACGGGRRGNGGASGWASGLGDYTARDDRRSLFRPLVSHSAVAEDGTVRTQPHRVEERGRGCR